MSPEQRAGNLIDTSMAWSSTPQGSKFWRAVNFRLCGLGKSTGGSNPNPEAPMGNGLCNIEAAKEALALLVQRDIEHDAQRELRKMIQAKDKKFAASPTRKRLLLAGGEMKR